jgi:HEAT repeat protein
VRRRIPHTIIRFEPQRAVEILSQHLERESDGSVRLKILRALGRLRARRPDAVIDETLLDEQLHRDLERIVQLLRWRSVIEESAPADSTDAELLGIALRDKEKAALQRAFGLMGLRYPNENPTLLWRGVQSENPRLQGASVEVLEAVLTGAAREAVIAILDTGEPGGQRSRAAAAALGIPWKPLTLREALDEMVEDRSEVVRSIAQHHREALGPPQTRTEVQTRA